MTVDCIGCLLMTYPKLHTKIYPSIICSLQNNLAEIFQESGDYCLCCWQKITCHNVQYHKDNSNRGIIKRNSHARYAFVFPETYDIHLSSITSYKPVYLGSSYLYIHHYDIYNIAIMDTEIDGSNNMQLSPFDAAKTIYDNIMNWYI